MASRSAATVTVVADPTEEPILLEWQDSEGFHSLLVEPEDPTWIAAHLWQTERENRRNCERDLGTKRAQITRLQREKSGADAAERKMHPQREFIEGLFDRWAELTGKTRCKLTPERFDMASARLAEDYSEQDLEMAIYGVALNPYVIEREVKNDWKTAMKDGESVERYANRCPAERRRQISGTLFEVVAA